MKKKVLLLVISLSIILLAGGCGKKNSSDDLSGNKSDTNTEGTDQAEVTQTPAPTKEKYNVDDYITLGEYKGVEVKVEKLEVTDANVDAAIQDDLEANATEEEVTGRAVQDGDIVNIDFEGLKDGVAFEGGTAQGQDLIIGSNSFIPGFEEGLIGAKKGDKLDLNLTFPEEYQSADLAGQAVVFKVTVNAIKQSVVPELTEEYVKEFTEYESIDAYKKATRDKLEADNQKEMEDNKMYSVISAIIEASEIKSVPQTLVDYYTYDFTSQYTQYAAMFGTDLAGFIAQSGSTQEEFDTQAKSYAQNMGTQELVINAIIEKEGLTLSDEEYQTGLDKIVTDYNYPSKEELLKSAAEDQIKESLLWQKAIQLVTSEAKEI
jgi:trigger factor